LASCRGVAASLIFIDVEFRNGPADPAGKGVLSAGCCNS
jgi:hypothetical protein